MDDKKTTVMLKGEKETPTMKVGMTMFRAGKPTYQMSPKEKAKPSGNMSDYINQKDTAGKLLELTPEELAQIWKDELPIHGSLTGNTILERGKLSKYKGKKLKIQFSDTGEIVSVQDPATGTMIIGGETEVAPAMEGYACGGEVKKKGYAEGGAVPAPAPETPEAAVGSEAGAQPEGNMTGPFETYRDVKGVDTQLVDMGNGLFTKLENAVTSGDEMAVQEYTDQLKSFINDVEASRQEAVNKMNDSALSTTYKEMANEARDLLAAFENISAERQSPEAMAANPATAKSSTVA